MNIVFLQHYSNKLLHNNYNFNIIPSYAFFYEKIRKIYKYIWFFFVLFFTKIHLNLKLFIKSLMNFIDEDNTIMNAYL